MAEFAYAHSANGRSKSHATLHIYAGAGSNFSKRHYWGRLGSSSRIGIFTLTQQKCGAGGPLLSIDPVAGTTGYMAGQPMPIGHILIGCVRSAKNEAMWTERNAAQMVCDGRGISECKYRVAELFILFGSAVCRCCGLYRVYCLSQPRTNTTNVYSTVGDAIIDTCPNDK